MLKPYKKDFMTEESKKINSRPSLLETGTIEEYRELTAEEAESMTLAELSEHIRKRPKLIHVYEEELVEGIKKIIKESQPQLRGEYQFYCIYQKPLGSTIRYSLIHTFYNESEKVKYENMDRIIFEDGNLIHDKLKESKLECDYFFIMPYFDFLDKSKSGVLLNDRIYETHEREEFEKKLIKDGK